MQNHSIGEDGARISFIKYLSCVYCVYTTLCKYCTLFWALGIGTFVGFILKAFIFPIHAGFQFGRYGS